MTYDVNEPYHDAVKKRCREAGFHDFVESADGKREIKLPNTTLIVEAENAQEAVEKFKEQVTSVSLGSLIFGNIIIEKVVGVELTGNCSTHPPWCKTLNQKIFSVRSEIAGFAIPK